MIFPRTSLHWQLITLQYWDYEYDLFYVTLNKNRGCLEKVTCLKYVILPWWLARLRPYAGFLSIIFFLCNAEDSSYETSPDEWYVIRPFITQKLVPYLSLIKYFFFSQRKFALLLRYRVIPLRYNARTH